MKLAPLVRELDETPDFEVLVCVTAQHRRMLDQMNSLFGILPDVDLDLMQDRQTIEGLTALALERLRSVIDETRPDVVVVQGDTTTTLAGAMASYYARVPVVHVEAGLRSGDPYNPYPEEMNRRLVSQLASLHLAPTRGNRRNLITEAVPPESIVVTGNTVIDALHWVVAQGAEAIDPVVRRVVNRTDGRVLLVTAHRRESWGAPLDAVAQALRALADQHPDLTILFPLHRNPAVSEVVRPLLDDIPRVELVGTLEYSDFVLALDRATVALTDSGGVQEEAPSLGKPVLVLRDVTERPEAVEAGTVRLVGTDTTAVVEAVSSLLTDHQLYERMARSVNPYGDGTAATRSVEALRYLLCGAAFPNEFEPVGIT